MLRVARIVGFCALLAAPLAAEHTHTKEGESKKPHSILDPVHYSIVITATPLDPKIDLRNAEVLRETLFTRDDQIFQLLDAGINAGQHEGGGKSLEIRRFGYNLDHGGGAGGLRVTVDNVPQNHSTQGHGQGYLGSLKSLSPELVEEVSLVNGPFSAEHGDFSGLGAVQVRLRETMPQLWTLRLQAGNFGSARGFLSWSPALANHDALFAYEGSHIDGPFLKPLGYVRHNVTGNYSWRQGAKGKIGVKWNGGSNEFNSSGQLPLDEVAAGRLNRFGSLSPGDGGRIQQGRLGLYFSRDLSGGAVLKADGYLERSLFDLYSNFTFLLHDPQNGDGIQQHDSRLSQGGHLQYLRPHLFGAGSALLTLGADLLASQNLIELRPSLNRNPIGLSTSANASVTSGGGYIQEQLDLLNGRLELGGGLRWDVFRYAVRDHLEPQFSGINVAAKLQPKASLAFSPWQGKPLRAFANYGRGISSLDARGVVRRPEGPHIATTDFIQIGTQHRVNDRFTFQPSLFLIQPSNQLVYIPDDGSIELAGPSRSYGFEAKTAVALTKALSLDAGITKVANAYYRDQSTRIYIDSAPRFVASASLTLARWRGFSGSFRMRAINHYRLDGENPAIVAAGNTVFDLAVARRIAPGLDLSMTIDNLLDREYWETQNYFASQLLNQNPIDRIHGTPGFGRTIAVGLTWRLGEK